ncbi:hypothetical protein Q31b_44780 [Novipirellula aureliae]|uniref:Transmembrane protein n=1 Tax=Novipirellula aureliae TaxID=2527966 RepID=A0A5C6DSD0_9BACT|nr:hypothetical protein [Novipirellula aureliae]TWU37689.1 hypothetical protein Q31b_44780 [Novipirellula aureliae]
MRIPSQFNEDSLYNRQPGHRIRRAESIQTNRRLIRLSLGLLLVVVVIRQVSKPEFYQPFFSDHQPAPKLVGPSHVSTAIDSSQKVAVEMDRALQTEADWIAAHIPLAEQPVWLAGCLRMKQQGESRQKNDVIDANMNRPESSWMAECFADPSAPIRQHERQGWIEFLNQFPLSVQSKRPETESTERNLRLETLIHALDQLAIGRVVDGGVWSGKDVDALYRFLAEAQYLAEAQNLAEAQYLAEARYTDPLAKRRSTQTDIGPLIGILPLLQQPEVYAGASVSFRGRVARCERQSTPEQSIASNAYGLTHYYRLWLRPLSGTDRPLLAIVPEVPKEVDAVGADNILSEGPPVMVAGRFLKRLAYRSAAGPDLAPVIVGRLVADPTDSERSSSPMTNASEANPTDQPQRLQFTSLFALVTSAFLVGSGLAAILFYRTNAQAKRSRQLRDTSMKDPSTFLNDLASRNE